jgi:ABC-type antimicrobial peptide transport system permease subunit
MENEFPFVQLILYRKDYRLVGIAVLGFHCCLEIGPFTGFIDPFSVGSGFFKNQLVPVEPVSAGEVDTLSGILNIGRDPDHFQIVW